MTSLNFTERSSLTNMQCSYRCKYFLCESFHTTGGVSPTYFARCMFNIQTGMTCQQMTSDPLMHIKINNFMESQSEVISKIAALLASAQKQGVRISDKDTQMIQDVEEMHKSTVKLQSKHKDAVAANSQSDKAVSQSKPHRVVSGKLRAPYF